MVTVGKPPSIAGFGGEAENIVAGTSGGRELASTLTRGDGTGVGADVSLFGFSSPTIRFLVFTLASEIKSDCQHNNKSNITTKTLQFPQAKHYFEFMLDHRT